MKHGWAARVWKWVSLALLSIGLAALIANRKLIVEALKAGSLARVYGII